MKIVKERILFEKFTADSDPIKDLGIGYDQYVMQKLHLKRYNSLPQIFENKRYWFSGWTQKESWSNIYKYQYDCLDFFGIKEIKGKQCIIASYPANDPFKTGNFNSDEFYYAYPIDQFHIDSIKESINEKFTEHSDPVYDLGIGLAAQIKEKIEKLESTKSWEFNTIQKMPGVSLGAKIILMLIHFDEYNSLIEYVIKNEHVSLEELNMCLRYACMQLSKNSAINLIEQGADPFHSEGVCYRLITNWRDRGRDNDMKEMVHILSQTRKQRISEAFREDSDPIYDLGIGIEQQIKQWYENQVSSNLSLDYSDQNTWYKIGAECIKQNNTVYLTFIIKQKLHDININNASLLRFSAWIQKKECVKILLNNGADLNIALNYSGPARPNRPPNEPQTYKQLLLIEKNLSMYLNEAFTEDGDPIHDMGIGYSEVVFICGNCGDLVDNYNEALPYDSSERKRAERTLKQFGEHDDRVKTTWCNYCQEVEYQHELDMQREEERKRAEAEADYQRWMEEQDERGSWGPY